MVLQLNHLSDELVKANGEIVRLTSIIDEANGDAEGQAAALRAARAQVQYSCQ